MMKGLPLAPSGHKLAMPSREQVVALLDAGHSFETAGRELHIPAGQAFMLATGLPADGSDSPHPSEMRQKRLLPGSSQHLVNPPPYNPTRHAAVSAWVQKRAAQELRKT